MIVVSSTLELIQTSTAVKKQWLESLSLVDKLKASKKNGDEQNKRSKQVLKGRIDLTTRKRYNVLLIVETWPSFATDYCLPSKDSQCWIHCPLCSKQLTMLIPKFCQWVTREEAMNISTSTLCSWIVIQGNLSSLMACLALI